MPWHVYTRQAGKQTQDNACRLYASRVGHIGPYMPGLGQELTVQPGGWAPTPLAGGSQHCMLACQDSQSAAIIAASSYLH